MVAVLLARRLLEQHGGEDHRRDRRVVAADLLPEAADAEALHQDHRGAGHHARQHGVDLAVGVEERQPAEVAIRGRELHRARDALGGVQHVAVCEHDGLRLRRCAGGEEHLHLVAEVERLAVEGAVGRRELLPGDRARRQRAGGRRDDDEPAHQRAVREHRLDHRQVLGLRDDHHRVAVADDELGLLGRERGDRRHADRTELRAGEPGQQHLRRVRQAEGDLVALAHPVELQAARDAVHRGVELGERELRQPPVVALEHPADLVGRLVRPLLEQIAQRPAADHVHPRPPPSRALVADRSHEAPRRCGAAPARDRWPAAAAPSCGSGAPRRARGTRA